MKMRKRSLPPGWYPGNKDGVEEYFNSWGINSPAGRRGCAAVVPHAGWFFSGKLAAETIALMDPDLETIIVAGGHLPPGSPVMVGTEESFQVPGGRLEGNPELTGEIMGFGNFQEDIYSDNTVEIQLPIVNYFWKDIKIVWLRIPPDNTAEALAKYIFEWNKKRHDKIGVIGSTDLTHYGMSYGFQPAGPGNRGLEWTRNNDREILDYMIYQDLEKILEKGNEDRAACSAGASAFAAEWAALNGSVKGELVDYYTSYDVHPGDSFVGYGGIIYEVI